MSIDSITNSQWEIIGIFFCGFIGLAVGSFLNVVIWRVPNDMSIIRPSSHCPKCNEPIRSLDNIPVLSYVVLGGKCRNCSNKISFRYPFIELLTCFVWIFTFIRLDAHISTIGYLLFFSGLLALSAIDIDTKLLPKKIVYPIGALLVVFLSADSIINQNYKQILDCLLVGLAYSAFLFVVWFATGGKAMGFGDVRLALFLGFAMGYFGFVVSYMGMLASFAIGSFIGIAIAAITQKGRKMKIPFGPFLAAGTVIAIWYAPQIHDLFQI
ncbi:MAG: prepilin peptidase [Acidimicrobiia bacterium]